MVTGSVAGNVLEKWPNIEPHDCNKLLFKNFLKIKLKTVQDLFQKIAHIEVC
jgi:hypothetical protein